MERHYWGDGEVIVKELIEGCTRLRFTVILLIYRKQRCAGAVFHDIKFFRFFDIAKIPNIAIF